MSAYERRQRQWQRSSCKLCIRLIICAPSQHTTGNASSSSDGIVPPNQPPPHDPCSAPRASFLTGCVQVSCQRSHTFRCGVGFRMCVTQWTGAMVAGAWLISELKRADTAAYQSSFFVMSHQAPACCFSACCCPFFLKQSRLTYNRRGTHTHIHRRTHRVRDWGSGSLGKGQNNCGHPHHGIGPVCHGLLR